MIFVLFYDYKKILWSNIQVVYFLFFSIVVLMKKGALKYSGKHHKKSPKRSRIF